MTLRRRLFLLHLYLGLTIGAAFAVMGATGAFLVYHRTLDAVWNPELLRGSGTGERITPGQALEQARAAHPEKTFERILLPRDAQGVYALRHTFKGGYGFVYVDPHGGRVLGEREWGRAGASLVYRLHSQFLLEENGKTVVGWMGVGLVLTVFCGWYLWWPKSWSNALAIAWRAPPLRRFRDLHKATGAVVGVVLLSNAVSGVSMTFPETFASAVSLFSVVSPKPKPVKGPEIRMTVDDAVAVGRTAFPDDPLAQVRLPGKKTSLYELIFRDPQEPRKTKGSNIALVDSHDGTLVEVRRWREFNAGEKFIGWMFPLHNGEALGAPGRAGVFLAGISLPVLYASGLFLWWRKRRS